MDSVPAMRAGAAARESFPRLTARARDLQIDRALRRLSPDRVLDARRGDASDDDGEFDAVLLADVLEHVEDDVELLRACRALLAEGGSLLVAVPADRRQRAALSGPLRRYRRSDLLAKLSVCGYRVRELTTWGFPFTAWLRPPEVPNGFGERIAAVLFAVATRIEGWLSFLDRGEGYVAVAERLSDEVDGEEIDVAA